MNPSGDHRPASEGRRGLIYGASAYGLWGLLPLYFVALAPSGAWEIVSMRVLFALALCLVLLGAFGQFGRFLAVFARPRTLGLFALSGALIGCNWLLYTIATTTGHTLEASLGYFINPLVAITLGVVVLRERLRRLQWVAVGLGAIAVGVMSVFYGQVPWLSLGLAFTFGLYGLTKSMLGGSWPALVALTVETLAIMPIAVVIVAQQAARGDLTLFGYGWLHTTLLAATGVVTVVPLLLFGLAAARLPLSTVGMLQYIAPIMQFLIAVFILHEAMPLERWMGFGFVWIAVAVLMVDATRLRRRRRHPPRR
ncbi:EamA family transporter RarD [Kocuria sp.]|uniref:EamA family transporter RarD n=1 Tax=Kocuria sp. TaxID=1871328 RepID=UPI0026DED036|nr:EamA family transporter RarD [Kocuria sp.]MDO5617460.1 EamA family transporter RarD [Kocuria sp.]